MNELLEHRGYTGTVEYSLVDNVLFGQVIGVRGLISYEGESLAALRADFVEAIDDYLLCCEEEGWEPMKPYSGNLVDIEISPDMHRNLYAYSDKRGKTPNRVVEEALRQYIT